jgi:hypothetical protein
MFHPPPASAATEEYNGSTWTTSPGSLNTARRALAGAGTQTAGLAFGGSFPAPTAATEEYDGTSWTSNPTDLNTARGFSRCRNSNSSISFWWCSWITGATEEYDGSAWTQLIL